MRLYRFDQRTRERREAFRFHVVLWSVILAGVLAVLFLYEHSHWVRELLGRNSGSIKMGVWILALPLIVVTYLFEKLRKSR
jgi:hypothetical protein